MHLPSLHFFDVPIWITKDRIRVRTDHRIWIEEINKGGQRSLHIIFSISDYPKYDERTRRKQEVEGIYWELHSEAMRRESVLHP